MAAVLLAGDGGFGILLSFDAALGFVAALSTPATLTRLARPLR
ncbi:MAG: hypothetical protein ACRECQ_17650 [Burkholderiaceae bacterium]